MFPLHVTLAATKPRIRNPGYGRRDESCSPYFIIRHPELQLPSVRSRAYFRFLSISMIAQSDLVVIQKSRERAGGVFARHIHRPGQHHLKIAV